MLDVFIYIAIVLLYPIILVTATLYTLLKRLLPAPTPKCIRDEIAVVTGGAAGLGRRICFELAKFGCHIAVVDVNLNGAKKVAQILEQKYGIKAKGYQVDISDRAAVQQLHVDVSVDLGDVTILCNNAGILIFTNTFKPDWQEVERMINVNVLGHIWMNEIFLPKMKELKHGHIIAIASIAGLMPLLHNDIYTASKYAVRGLMRSLRISLRAENHSDIKTTIVYPYFMRTNTMVTALIDNLHISSIYPVVTDEHVAKQIVEGVLRNEDEIAVPNIFQLLYRLYESLPTGWQDFFNCLICRIASKRYAALQTANNIKDNY